MNIKEIKSKIPKNGKFVWAKKSESIPIDDFTSIEFRKLYFVAKNAVITGGMVTSPQARMGDPGSSNSGQWVVNLSMTPAGARKWRVFTGANISKQVAIILDNRVYMAPYIRDKISTGATQISGFENSKEAIDIANVLLAGELPAPVQIVQEQTIGPSLGKDSIKSGQKAMLIGIAITMLFMFLYYKVGGVIANIALILNLLFISISL